MSVEVVSFGCRLNGVEAETMRSRAEAAGCRDVTVVNTCAVTAEAVRQGRQAVRKAARARPGRVVVTGCAAEVAPHEFGEIDGVARVVGNPAKLDPANWFAAGRADGPRRPEAVSDASARRVRAFVQVQTGCDHRCTFCVIPFGRGGSRSVPADLVVEAVREAAAGAAREVVLTGVDLTAYGIDLPGEERLGTLVGRILRDVPELPRLRLSSVDSVELDPDLLRLLRTEPRLMPHLHLSLQAGDDLILTRMKRRHRRADAIALCRELRRARPDTVFGADLIAGFPTETDAMFRRSLDLVEECGLTFLHVFPYSARPGTPAARMPAVPAEAVRERAALLRRAGEVALERHLLGEVGTVRAVLAENEGFGRTEGFAPVRFGAPAERGTIRPVRILGQAGGALLAA